MRPLGRRALAGGGTNRPETQVSDTIINSMLSIVIDPAALTNEERVEGEADALCAWVKSRRPRAPDLDGVMVPGEPERRMRRRSASGKASRSTATLGSRSWMWRARPAAGRAKFRRLRPPP